MRTEASMCCKIHALHFYPNNERPEQVYRIAGSDDAQSFGMHP